MWSERHGDEVYVYHNGRLIYKRWLNEDGTKRRSALFNEQWPTVWIDPRSRSGCGLFGCCWAPGVVTTEASTRQRI